jgi:hypothetical protein
MRIPYDELPWHAKARKGLTDFETLLYSMGDSSEEDGNEVTDDKCRFKTKPKCNLAPSTAPWRNFTISREPDDSLFHDMAAHAIGYQHSTPIAIAHILQDRLDAWLSAGLRDTTTEALRNRVTIEKYNVDFPEKDNPDHTLFPRESRNASPTRRKDAGLLNAFWDYRELNNSFESSQSNWRQADNDNYGEEDREEGDLKKPERDAEAELEMRPGVNELISRYDVPTIKYKIRQVGLITGPKLSDFGYCMAPTSPLIREMTVPVDGDVECIGFRKDNLSEYVTSAHAALPKRGVRRTQKQIDAYVDRLAKPELLNIDDLAKDRKWTIYQVGGLRFSPLRTKHHWRGQLTHYRDENNNDRWFPAKEDDYGTPKGPEIKEDVKAAKGSIDAAWSALHPANKREVVYLPSAERAKQLANKSKPIPCLPPTDELLEAFRLKLHSNGTPANDNQHHDGLPYDVDSRDQLQFGYAFGTTRTDVSDSEPFDDVTERKSVLTALNAGLSSQARLVANMVVQTDETETVAQNYVQVGAALATGRRKTPSERTLMRHGQQAVNEAAKEIGAILQQLAA